MSCKAITKVLIEEISDEVEKSSDGASAGFDASAPTKVIELEWPEPNKFQIPGESEQYGDISVYQGTYQVTLHGMGEGSIFTVDGTKNTVDSKVFDIIKVKDMTSHLGGLKITELNSATLDPGLEAELHVTGKRAKFKLPPARILGLDDILKKVENTPVVFEGEPPKEGDGFSILSLSSVTPEVYGKATLLRDVDGIALTRKLDVVKGTKTCSGYKDKDKKPVPDIQLQLKETEVVVYDRRTSEVVAKTVLPPDDGCPMFSFGVKDDRKTDSSSPLQKIEEWLRSQVKR